MRYFLRIVLVLALLLPLYLLVSSQAGSGFADDPAGPEPPSASVTPESGPAGGAGEPSNSMQENWSLYLPLLRQLGGSQAPQATGTRVNVPYFKAEVPFRETAIFWFGQVSSGSNYTDVRIAYTDEEIYVHLAIFDRFLWYDPKHALASLDEWDAASLYLNLGSAAAPETYRFIGQLSWWEENRADFQAGYRRTGTTWEKMSQTFSTESGWRGNAPNDNTKNDRGWTLTYHIPFKSLGLSGPPPQGTVWGLGVAVHSRSDAAAAPLPDQVWPKGMQPSKPSTWGDLAFGLPEYSPPQASGLETILLRNGLNGVTVVDGEVGGSTTCGKDLDFWSEWGNHVTPGSVDNADFNIQNQADVADWPCFAKYYITIPLDLIPPGKVIVSAKLTLHQFGNSGGGKWGLPPSALIQVLTVSEDWQEATLTWNNAPLASENVSRAWVDPLDGFPGWPGVPRYWDVSRAAAQAYLAGAPLRLAFYSADGGYHSGKYFSSSDTPDWNQKARPTLEITFGNP